MSSGGMSSALGKLDPLGNKITQWGGDPLNLYGNQNNPNAALFPYGTVASSVPGVLPNLGAGSLMPRPPQGAFAPPSSGGGAFNGMAQQLAGPLYEPGVSFPNEPQPVTVRTNAPVTLPSLLAAYRQSIGAAGGRAK